MVNPERPSREDYYSVLIDALPAGTAVVTALGNASYLWAALRDAPENFYVEDAMGLTLPLALGLAVARPDRPRILNAVVTCRGGWGRARYSSRHSSSSAVQGASKLLNKYVLHTCLVGQVSTSILVNSNSSSLANRRPMLRSMFS